MPFFEMIESGHEPVRDEEHEPEHEAVEAAAAAPEGFVLVVGEEHGQGHDEDQGNEADVRLRELRSEGAPLQILLQIRCKCASIPTFIRKKIENPQHEEKGAVDKGRNPVELEAELQDIEVLITGCERKHAEIKKHVDRHQRTGDVTETLIDVSTFSACKRVLYALRFLYCFCCVSGFLLLAHREAPLSN